MRRRAYVLAALVSAAAHLGILALKVPRGEWQDLPSFLTGLVVSVLVAWALTWGRLPTAQLNAPVAAAVTLATTVEFLPLVSAPAVGTQAYLTFVGTVALWFGLLPIRLAAALSGTAYALFAALILTRPAPDVTLLTYLACITIVVGMVASFGQRVITYQQEAATFQQDALTDPLTGLPNRRALLTRLHAMWSAGTGFALLMLDLDHFKAVNDRYGHTAGDQVLAGTGAALLALIGPDGPDHTTLARWGGEEFMLLLPGVTARQAYAVTDRLQGAGLTLGAGLPRVTFSAGAALSHEAATLDALLERVDERLHAAKAAGRRQVCWTAPAPAQGGPSAPPGLDSPGTGAPREHAPPGTDACTNVCTDTFADAR
ncbi:diguanylate cyclase domain-containing protein [Deinococcus aquaticus]|uniref:GGDEF domain-containing protein n=1 Tax=Deinococcus aquaticus TaxID=328692 RepID=UPI003F462568